MLYLEKSFIYSWWIELKSFSMLMMNLIIPYDVFLYFPRVAFSISSKKTL